MTTDHAPPTPPQDALRSWRLDLPWSRPPLTSNGGHGNRYALAKQKKSVRRTGYALATSKRVPALARVRIELHYVPRDRRYRDPGNLWPTRKALEDGIVDAGVVPGDDPRYSEPTVPAVIHEPDPAARVRMYLLITELPPAAAP